MEIKKKSSYRRGTYQSKQKRKTIKAFKKRETEITPREEAIRKKTNQNTMTKALFLHRIWEGVREHSVKKQKHQVIHKVITFHKPIQELMLQDN